MTNVKHTIELEVEIKRLKEKADLYDIIQNQEPHGSAIDTMAQEIKELKGRYPKKIEWYEELERKFNLAFDEVVKLKEYKAEVERLADDDLFWQKVADYDVIKQELKDRSEHIEVLWNSEANLRQKLDKIQKEFIDCDEYPPLTKWWKENQ